MKTLRLFGMIFLAISLCLSACDKIDTPVEPTPDSKPEGVKSDITMDADIITNGLSFTNEAGEKSISFTTNEDWTLSIAAVPSGDAWCTASATSGAKGNANVKFTVTENTSYDDRSVSVTIKSGNASKTFTITQKHADALLLTANKYELSQEGGTIEIEVKANIDYEMEIAESSKDWITEANTRALPAYKHTLNIAINEEVEKREGEIYFKSGDKIETVKFYQAGGALILLSKDEYTVSANGETISVDIKSNVEYAVQMPNVDWITDEATTRGMSSHTRRYIIAPNEGYENRSSEIIFYDKNSDLKDTLKVVQLQQDALIISKNEYNITSEGGVIEVGISSNIGYDYYIPESCNWITITDCNTRSLSTEKLLFKIEKNEEINSRSAIIQFYNTERTVADSIKIFQVGNITEIFVQEAGTLNSLISEEDKWSLEALKISGKINGTDLRLILEMIGDSNDPEEWKEGVLTTLDLSEAKIVEGGDSYTTDHMWNPLYTKNDELGDYMFWYSNIKHIVLPKDIKVVGKYALGWCNQLQSVKMFENIEKLDDRAFCDSPNLQSIEIPNGVTYIGEQTFAGININNINIPNTVTHIGNEAFCNSGIVSVTIPNSVEFLGNSVFKGCAKLEEYRGNYASKDNKCLIYKDTLICYAYGNKDSVYNIPSEVVCIGKNSFTGAQYLTSIIIPDNVHRIQDEAFQYVPLETIELSNGVEHIEELAFVNCTTIKAFYGKYASEDNKCLIYDGTLIKYASGLTDETYNTPEEVTKIGNSAFRQAKLKSIKLHSSVTKIEDSAFHSCYYLENIEISNNLLTIGNLAFCYCMNLLSIELPDILTSIGESAFCQCEKLTTFIIPVSLKSIGEQAFVYCNDLKEIYCYPIDPPTIYPKTSTNYGYSLGWIDPIIYVPEGSLYKYQYSDFGYGYTIKEM